MHAGFAIEQQADELKTILMEFREIRTGILFGSHASNRARSDSDMDIAVWVGRPMTLDEQSFLRIQLVERLMNRFRCPVDVVLLDTAPPFLRQQIFNKGVELFVLDKDKWNAFRVKGYLEAFDFRHIMNIQYEADKRRILEEVGHG